MIADRYWEAVAGGLARIRRTQGAAVRRAGGWVAASLARGGVLFTFGTGHSRLAAEELFHRAGGLVPVRALVHPQFCSALRGARTALASERTTRWARALVRRAGFRRGDAGIVISHSGRNVAPVEMALAMRRAGMRVIAVCAKGYAATLPPLHASGRRLFEAADLTLDTGGAAADAAVRVPGVPEPMGAMSLVAAAVLLHGVAVEAAAALARRGREVPVFQSVNRPDADPRQAGRLVRRWARRIPELRR